jgi:hypothetical protein
VQKKNPEDGKNLSTVTKVILNDLKGVREIKHDFKKKKRFQRRKITTEQKGETDHRQWMPKTIPQEMKLALKETEKQQKKRARPRKKISVQKRRDKFEYVVQLRNGKTIKTERVIIKGGSVILIAQEIKTVVPAGSIQWIKETRVRVMTLKEVQIL